MNKTTAMIVTALAMITASIHADVVGIGETGYLKSDAGQVVAAKTKADYDKYFDAVMANDDYGVGELAMAGRISLVPSGTKILVLGYGSMLEGKTEFRIVEGKFAGRRCWTQTDFISGSK
jgi:hypothetical protein